MATIRTTAEFRLWFAALRDPRAKARIAVRIRRLELGNAGQAAAVGQGVSEMKIDYGPGYRIYFKRSGLEIVVLLCGGDKSTQPRDIERAKMLAAQDV